MPHGRTLPIAAGHRDGPNFGTRHPNDQATTPVRSSTPAVMSWRAVEDKRRARRPYRPFQRAAHPMARKGTSSPADHRLLAGLIVPAYAAFGTKMPTPADQGWACQSPGKLP
jgi:hypothetical protein